MKLSFIVTFHNGDKFIRPCLDSLLSQDIDTSEYEVIVVDDCSSSLEGLRILDEYQSSFSNVRVIHNSTNLRTGESRNVGIRAAKGEYLWFIDQDDFVEENSLKELLDVCDSNNLDILTFDYLCVPVVGATYGGSNITIPNMVMNGLDYIRGNSDGSIHGRGCFNIYVWHYLFKREFLIESCLWYPPIYSHEDVLFAFAALISAKRVLAIEKAAYYYRENEISLTHTTYKTKAEAIYCGSIILGTIELELCDKVPNGYEDIKKQMCDCSIAAINTFTKPLISISRNEKKNFFHRLKNDPERYLISYSRMSNFNRFIINHRFVTLNFPFVLLLVRKIYKLVGLQNRINGYSLLSQR